MLLYLSKFHVTDKKENVLSTPPIKPVLVLRLPRGRGFPAASRKPSPREALFQRLFPNGALGPARQED